MTEKTYENAEEWLKNIILEIVLGEEVWPY